jgi:hypothetical protein
MIKISRAVSGRNIPGFKDYWRPKLLNSISRKATDPKIYAWLWWNILVERG